MTLAYRTALFARIRRVAVSVGLLVVLVSLAGVAGAQAKKIEPKLPAGGAELTVFSAADMQPVFEVLGPYFERRTGIKLKMVYGPSGRLAEQIVNGAPADIFFSADFTFAERVVAAGKADNVNPYPYAKGILVLWARKDSRFNPLSVDVLSRKDLKSVAIANPSTAPYGRAALAAMTQLKVVGNVTPHLVEAESVGQAAQFALSGNAELALISETIAYSPAYRAAGNAVLFPLSTYMDIRQCAVVVKGGSHQTEAHTLLNYLTSDEIQNHLADLGLQRFQ